MENTQQPVVRRKRNQGQGLAEYSLILALVAVVCVSIIAVSTVTDAAATSPSSFGATKCVITSVPTSPASRVTTVVATFQTAPRTAPSATEDTDFGYHDSGESRAILRA